MNGICYFELPADDTGRARKFYGELFCWQFESMTMGDTPYWTIKTPDGISGGLMSRQQQGQQPVMYVQVENVDETLDSARSMGSNVLLDKTAVPAMGWFALLQDPDRNAIGLWQTDENAK
jgi:hypothetical protein